MNGPSADDLPPLTNDLDKDPLVYFQRGGMRIVMPYDPRFITTNTVYGDLGAGRTDMAGLFMVKRRGRPADAPHGRKQPKVQFGATPLFLGVSNGDDRDEDLTEKVVFEGHTRNGSKWFGPWSK